MSVYIKGIEMPKNGSCIQIVIDDDGKVYPSVEKCILKMGSIAKAVPVQPHGDLIEREKCVYANWYEGNPPCCTHECDGCIWNDDKEAEEDK